MGTAPMSPNASSPHNPTRLYCVEPIGLRSYACEAMSSWFLRESASYCVRPNDLATWLTGLRSVFWGTSCSDGVSPLAALFLARLVELTGRPELSLSSLQPWRSVLSGMELVNPHFRWCPVCYARQRADRIPAHDALAWRLNAVDYCLLDGEPLEDKCRRCGAIAHAIWGRLTPGWCPTCGNWLGEERLSDSRWQPPPEAVQLRRLLEAAELGPEASSGAVQAGWQVVCDALFEGNQKKASRELGVSPLWTGSRYRLRTVLSVAAGAGVDLVDLLIGRRLEPQSRLPLKAASPKRSRPPDIEIETALRSAIENRSGESFTGLCRDLGVNRGYVRRRWPLLEESLLIAHAEWSRSARAAWLATETAGIDVGFTDLLAQGRIPNTRNIQAYGTPGALKDPQLQAYFEEAVRRIA